MTEEIALPQLNPEADQGIGLRLGLDAFGNEATVGLEGEVLETGGECLVASGPGRSHEPV